MQPGSATADDPVRQLLRIVDQKIRRVRSERFGLESPGYAICRDAGVARGLHVYRAVAHHGGLPAPGAALGHQGLDTDGMRFLLLEAVAAVDALEMRGEAEAVDDGLAETQKKPHPIG